MKRDRLLLDTHVLLWWNEDRLPGATTACIQQAGDVLVSIVSAWEITIKVAKKRLHVPLPVGEMLDRAGFDLLSLSLDHVAELQSLPHHHADPFDRMLIAQARVEDLVLVSKDHWVKNYQVQTFWQD